MWSHSTPLGFSSNRLTPILSPCLPRNSAEMCPVGHRSCSAMDCWKAGRKGLPGWLHRTGVTANGILRYPTIHYDWLKRNSWFPVNIIAWMFFIVLPPGFFWHESSSHPFTSQASMPNTGPVAQCCAPVVGWDQGPRGAIVDCQGRSKNRLQLFPNQHWVDTVFTVSKQTNSVLFPNQNKNITMILGFLAIFCSLHRIIFHYVAWVFAWKYTKKNWLIFSVLLFWLPFQTSSWSLHFHILPHLLKWVPYPVISYYIPIVSLYTIHTQNISNIWQSRPDCQAYITLQL